MTLDPRRARIWNALGLGPVWSSRATEGQAAAVAGAQSGGDPAPELPRSQRIALMDWSELEASVARCEACALSRTRTQTVFGVGNRSAQWMLVGEAPGAEEDARGEPFVGQAGRLLDNMLASVGLGRRGDGPEAVFIANVLKCRPPGNRNPEPGEVHECEPFLKRQIELVNPRLVLVMGRFAAQSLLGTDAAIASLRGKVHAIDIAGRSVPVVVTYHPAYLLRNLADKSKSWADLCLAREVVARGR
ncbi:MAG TPA: uracil-DNA glycosylase [Burkholderiaceae bacterium]|nr:uracil-DNA glycosylase [Burkholderiaceae bacterium]